MSDISASVSRHAYLHIERNHWNGQESLVGLIWLIISDPVQVANYFFIIHL